ncbi:hypothetical protein [Mycobacteroides abscessus]|uniref:hypothetical protein n=1 Tax=Mycobacteroides abscessus TaxID=36809 RepID=UPI0010573B5B|nr:hypothetical protein [Mycobacteroides abscessus]
MATTLSNGGKVKYSVDIWSPDSGDKSEVVQMIDALRNIDVEVNIIPIRNLYKPELHVGFDEYVGLGGVRRFLDEHRKSSQ